MVGSLKLEEASRFTLKAYLRADDRGDRAGLSDIMAGLACRRLVDVVLMSRGSEKTAGDVGGPKGVGWRRWRSRGATMSRGGRLVIHGWDWLMVRRWQGEGAGAWRGGRGGEQVRLVQVGVVGVVVMRVRVVVVEKTRVPSRLPRRGLCIAAGDEVSVLELGAARLLRRQLELDKHHVVTNAQRQGEGGAARQEVIDLQTKKRDFESLHSENCQNSAGENHPVLINVTQGSL